VVPLKLEIENCAAKAWAARATWLSLRLAQYSHDG